MGDRTGRPHTMPLPNLKDRKPTPIKRKNNSVIFWLKSTSTKNRIASGLSALAALTLLLVLGRLMSNPSQQLADAPKSELEMRSQFSDIKSPLAFTGLEDGELAQLPIPEQVDVLYKGLSQFDEWLARKADSSVYALITHESARLKSAAEEEVRDGKIDTNDKTGAFQVNECLATIPPVYCVLLRYSGDGIKEMSEASEADDVYGYMHGYIRTRAALLALSIDEIKVPDSKPVIGGLINYRMVMEKLIEITPPGQRLPTDAIQAPIGDRSPGAAFQDKYPNDKEVRN